MQELYVNTVNLIAQAIIVQPEWRRNVAISQTRDAFFYLRGAVPRDGNAVTGKSHILSLR